MLKYKGVTLNSLQEILDYCVQHPEAVNDICNLVPGFRNTWQAYQQAMQAVENGDPNGVYAAVGGSNFDISPETEKYLDNAIARENTQQAQGYEEHMRDTSLTSAGNQLSELGLSTSNVVQTGGASSNGVGAASTNMHSVASLKQQRRINDYNNKMGLAKTLISSAGSMASSGIYGAALGAIKNTASKVASSAAHSGVKALSAMQKDDGKWLADWYDNGGTTDNASGYLIPDTY